MALKTNNEGHKFLVYHINKKVSNGQKCDYILKTWKNSLKLYKDLKNNTDITYISIYNTANKNDSLVFFRK